MNAISNKLQRIQGSMLLKYDPDLANHLKKIEVTPQVYGMYVIYSQMSDQTLAIIDVYHQRQNYFRA